MPRTENKAAGLRPYEECFTVQVSGLFLTITCNAHKAYSMFSHIQHWPTVTLHDFQIHQIAVQSLYSTCSLIIWSLEVVVVFTLHDRPATWSQTLQDLSPGESEESLTPFGLQTTTGHENACEKSLGNLRNTKPVVVLVDVVFGSRIHKLACFYTSLLYINVPLGATTNLHTVPGNPSTLVFTR